MRRWIMVRRVAPGTPGGKSPASGGVFVAPVWYLAPMRSLARRLGSIAATFLAVSCVSYTGVNRASDGTLYISGGTNYVVFTSPWVRRCTVDGQKLNCDELSESPSRAKRAAAGGAAAPPPAASPAPPAPAPPAEPVPDVKPAKHR